MGVDVYRILRENRPSKCSPLLELANKKERVSPLPVICNGICSGRREPIIMEKKKLLHAGWLINSNSNSLFISAAVRGISFMGAALQCQPSSAPSFLWTDGEA